MTSAMKLDVVNGRVEVDPVTGGLTTLQLTEPDTSFITQPAAAGLLRFALPLEHHAGHHVEVGTHGRPAVERLDGGLRLRYDTLATSEGPIAVRVEVDLMAAEDGLRLRARVHNGGSAAIPQVLFPQLLGLAAVDGADQTRLQLGRGQMRPLREISVRPDEIRHIQINLQRYLPYGRGPHIMKWLDYGSARRGFTLYREDPRDVTQALLVDRPDRMDDRINLSWVHYPFIQPGETWDSREYVLLPHAGDWYAGARAYQRYAAEHYPYHAPQRVREALGVRTMFCKVRSAPPTFPLSAIAEYAAEIADPDLGLAELIVWHWWLKNGLPILLDTELGTEEEFAAAIRRCRELGVPVSLFVSHHLVRDTEETDPSWVYRNAAGQPEYFNATWGEGLSPRFRPAFIATHSLLRATALSPGWRAKSMEDYRSLQEKYGPVSISFDIFGATPDPDFNPAADGRPDEEGEKMLELARQARALIYEGDPVGSFSGEHIADSRVPVLDYTWEWRNGFQLEAQAPFRYVFPHFRQNANVNTHPRSALVAFTEGALLNVLPGDIHSFRLRDCPDLVAMLRKLAVLRRRFLPFFTEGQYRYVEGLETDGALGRVYTRGADVLLIVANPGDAPAETTIRFDPSVWGDALGAARITAYDATGQEVDQTHHAGGTLERSFRLEADDLRTLEVIQRRGS